MNYVRREIKEEGLMTLKGLMTGGNDIKHFGSWSKILVQTFMNGMILHGYCLGVRINEDSTLNEVKARDMHMFRETMWELEHFIRSNTEQIKRNYAIFRERGGRVRHKPRSPRPQ